MELTGERVVPDLMQPDDSVLIEHIVRYGFATAFAAGKRVLDACCGVGYGAAMMAVVAKEVMGFDRDTETIDYAESTYGCVDELLAAIRYEVSDVFDWDEGDFDLIVAFEAIEHMEDALGFLQILQRAVKPDGEVILSCPAPHRCVLSDYHEHCYSLGEFADLVLMHFTGDFYMQQGACIGSLGMMSNGDFYIFKGRPK